MEVFSKISTLQQQQFVYMIDCVWSFLIACVFNLQIRRGRRLQFTFAKRWCLYLSKWVVEERRKTTTTQMIHKNAHNRYFLSKSWIFRKSSHLKKSFKEMVCEMCCDVHNNKQHFFWLHVFLVSINEKSSGCVLSSTGPNLEAELFDRWHAMKSDFLFQF